MGRVSSSKEGHLCARSLVKGTRTAGLEMEYMMVVGDL